MLRGEAVSIALPFVIFATVAHAVVCDAAKSFPWRDFSGDKSRDSVIAAGTPTRFEGHPTTVTTADGRIIAVWCSPHGGGAGWAAESSDGGKSWRRIDDRFPPGFRIHANSPSIYRLTGPDGKARLWVWSATKQRPNDKKLDFWTCRKYREMAMPSVMSEDEGLTWQERPPMGEKFFCVMAFSSVIRLKDGSYLGLFHKGECTNSDPLKVMQSITRDGGFTWSDPVEVCVVQGKHPCEPCAFRSPDGNEICCLMRENSHKGCSLMMFTRDEGRTWTRAIDAPWEISGDEHHCLELGKGKFIVVFREHNQPKGPTWGQPVAWVGSYDDLKCRRRGDAYKVKLFHSFKIPDCGNPTIQKLGNGDLLVVAYLKYWDDARQNSVVAKRFQVEF